MKFPVLKLFLIRSRYKTALSLPSRIVDQLTTAKNRYQRYRIFGWLFLFSLAMSFVSAGERPRPVICLNMIVKDETSVIRRCLESVKPLIDYWVIVDTGSKDGTQEMIKEFMRDIPGELHERPWVDFAHNRNEALSLAKNKADYLLFIDADDVLTGASTFVRPKLDKDFYYLKINYSNVIYNRTQLVKSSLDWRWVGVLHEVIISPQARSSDVLDGITMKIVGGGDRSQDVKKFEKDIAVLEKALKTDPNNARYLFYLAQSYRDAEKPHLAMKTYRKRVDIGGWSEEVFWSLYQIAMLQETLNMAEEIVCKGYRDVFAYRPVRAEPLYRLSNYYRRKENYLLGYLFANFGLTIKPPNDILFVESWIYEYGLLLESSICAYWIGRYEEALDTCLQLLANDQLPANVRECVEKNLAFTMQKLPAKSDPNIAKKAG